jgi:tellurite resistance protein TerC
MKQMSSLLLLAAEGAPPGADIAVDNIWWIGLLSLVAVLILADLFLFNREAHEIDVREAAISSAIWIAIGLSFGVVVWFGLGPEAGSQYFAGYLIEKSLSVDNVFVWAVILGYFAVPRAYQHRVLFWGIFGALILRAIFIFAGVALLERLGWLVLVFGAFLVFTGVRVGIQDDDEIDPNQNPVLNFLRRHLTMTDDYHGAHFFIKDAGKRVATPMFAVLVMVELTDVVFAIDSIPAILAVSRSTFIVFSSNAFAILGLRALFFVLAGFKDKLVHLNKGLGVILVFVGIKMLLSFWDFHIDIRLSLAFIAGVLAVTVALSLMSADDDDADDADDADEVGSGERGTDAADGKGAGPHVPGPTSGGSTGGTTA